MIDEISLVEYSDEETADSEQLESFRKFCEEQNSEGVRESTPSASNTESAYLVDIYGGFNQEIDKLATIPQSWSGERQEEAGDLTTRQDQPRKKGGIKRITPESLDMMDLSVFTDPAEDTLREDGGAGKPTMKEATLANVTKGRYQRGGGAQCSGDEASRIDQPEPPRSQKPDVMHAQYPGRVAPPRSKESEGHEGPREHRLDRMKREDPELYRTYFQGAVKGKSGADGKDKVLKINRYAQKGGSLTEVRWDAELCPGCEAEWLLPGTELFKKVCTRCYATSGPRKAMQHPSQIQQDEEVARALQEEEFAAGGTVAAAEEEWTTVGGPLVKKRGVAVREPDRAVRFVDTPTQEAKKAKPQSPLEELVRAEEKRQVQAKKVRAAQVTTQSFIPITDGSEAKLREAMLWHLVEPLSDVQLRDYTEVIGRRLIAEGGQTAGLYEVGDDTLLGAWKLALNTVIESRYPSDHCKEYCEEWRGELVAGSKSRRLQAIVRAGQLRDQVAYWWRFASLLKRVEEQALAGSLAKLVEARGPPLEDYRLKMQQAERELGHSPAVLSAYKETRYHSPVGTANRFTELAVRDGEGEEDYEEEDDESTLEAEEHDRLVSPTFTPESKGSSAQSRSSRMRTPQEAALTKRLARAAKRANKAVPGGYESASDDTSESPKSATNKDEGGRRKKADATKKEEESASSTSHTSDSEEAGPFSRGRRSKKRKTYGEECAYAGRHPGIKDEWEGKLKRKFKRWLKDNLEGLSEEKRTFVNGIEPRIIYLPGKTLSSTALCKPPKIGYRSGPKSILDARESFRLLDNYMMTSTCPPYRLLLQAWNGEVYQGRLEKEMRPVLQGETEYLTTNAEVVAAGETDVVGSCLAYYQWQVALVRVAAQIDNDSYIWDRIAELTMPTSGDLVDWKDAFLQFRNEYQKLNAKHRNGADMWRRLREKCAASPSSMAWIRAMTDWRTKTGRSEDSAWTEELLDRAVSAVHAEAEEGVNHIMIDWDRKKSGRRGEVVERRTIAAVAQTSSAGVTEMGECWCQLRHRGPRSLTGCALRSALRPDGVTFVTCGTYAGYDPISLSRVAPLRTIGGVSNKMEAAPDGLFKQLSPDIKKEFWKKYNEAAKGDETETMRKVGMCALVRQPTTHLSEATDSDDEDIPELISDSDDEEEEESGSGNVERDSDTRAAGGNVGSESAEEAEYQSSDDELLEDPIPRRQICTTAYQLHEEGEEAERVTMLPCRLFVRGHDVLGQEATRDHRGKQVYIFVDQGADVSGVDAQYCDQMGIPRIDMDPSRWFRLDLALEGRDTSSVIKHEVEVEFDLRGREFLGKDRNLRTTLGKVCQGTMKVRLPVIEGLTHHIVMGTDVVGKYHSEEDKTAKLFTTRVEERDVVMSCPTLRLHEAAEQLQARRGSHGRLLQKLRCWVNIMRRLRVNLKRRSLHLVNKCMTDIAPGTATFIPLVSRPGAPPAERPGLVHAEMESMIRVDRVMNMPQMKVGCSSFDQFKVVSQDLVRGTWGIWVRNEGHSSATLPFGVISARVIPVMMVESIRNVWYAEDLHPGCGLPYADEIHVRGQYGTSTSAVDINAPPAWLQEDLRFLWRLIEPAQRQRLWAEAPTWYTPERFQEVQRDLVEQLDVNPGLSVYMPEWWGPSQVSERGEDTVVEPEATETTPTTAPKGMLMPRITPPIPTDTSQKERIHVDLTGPQLVQELRAEGNTEPEECGDNDDLPPLVYDSDSDDEDGYAPK